LFTGRIQELKQLEEVYLSPNNSCMVIYGRVGIGKTELVTHFMKDKQGVYYLAKELSYKEQTNCMSRELTGDDSVTLSMHDSISYAIRKIRRPEKKTILVIDEFQNLIGEDYDLRDLLFTLLSDTNQTDRLMIVLLSSSVRWIENNMIEECPYIGKMIRRPIKLKEFTFMEMVSRFPKLPVDEVLYAGAVTGGVPKYTNFWNPQSGFRDNIIRMFFNPMSPLFYEAEFILKKELRELASYNAILTAIAQGNYKLNDIYKRTGYSRPKISVYMKNLSEMDVIEKIFSYDAAEHKNVQKGLYRIRDPFLRFYYRYVFPEQSACMRGDAQGVYDRLVAPNLGEFMRECFADICTEFLKLSCESGNLRYEYKSWGKWYGKTGLIDIVAGDEEDNTLVAFCNYENRELTAEDLESALALFAPAGLDPKEIFIFSKTGFSSVMKALAERKNVKLVLLSEL